ncbi:MAG TPA: hypothetical protein EYG10_06255 [Gammaproteobacteria bacterium]|jgi:uncharacterized repeat protein (TIGR03806 family)|nr:hypothetical protein [Gammaproteobacteria bacterium]
MRAKKSILWLVIAALFMFSNTQANVNDEAILSEDFPIKLSTYGFFDNLGEQRPKSEVLPYSLITVLFSDYADKDRFVYVPVEKTANYVENSVFQFPVGTALIKTFSYSKRINDSDVGKELIETRLLLRKHDRWETLAYVWNEDQTEAYLKVAGKTVNTRFTDAAGKIRPVRYRVPNKNQCKECHASGDSIVPIGPKPRNLNMDFDYPNQTMNQLVKWSQMGIIDNYPHTVKPVADFTDPSKDIEARARAYLAINCGHCHSPKGSASSTGLYLNYGEQRPKQLGILKPPVAAGRGSGGLNYSIVPGNPDASILLFRMISDDPAVMMPESGRSLIHQEAVRLIHDWIKAMEDEVR